jgi:DinB superfamily
MDTHRKAWNQQQQALRQSLTSLENLSGAIEIFLRQHAMLHAGGMSEMDLWSFEDETLDGLSDQQMRIIPGNLEHSITWVVWHMTRIEDATMNLLVAGSPQVLFDEGWLERLGISDFDTANGMEPAGVAALSATINLPVLRGYRLSVGRRTRAIVRQLGVQQLKQKVDPARLEKMTTQGAVRAEASGLLEYWGGLTITGLLLMPPTRHTFVHWNEALQIKQKIS